MSNIEINNSLCPQKLCLNYALIAVLGIFFYNRLELFTVSMVALSIIYSKKILFSNFSISMLLSVGLLEIIIIYYGGYSYNKFLQQYLVICVLVLCYGIIFKHNENKCDNFFFIYVLLTYYISIIGILQVICYMIFGINVMNFGLGYHLTQSFNSYLIRATSTLSEGGHLGNILIPSIVYLFYYNDPYRLLKNKKKYVLIAGLLTWAPLVYLTLAAIFVMKLLKKSKTYKYILLTFLIPILLISGVIIINSKTTSDKGYEGLVLRIKDTYNLLIRSLNGEQITYIEYNVSTAVLAKSLTTLQNSPNIITGTGLGTFAQLSQSTNKKVNLGYEAIEDLNNEDGYSLAIRFIAEFGVVGLLIYSFIMYSLFNKTSIVNTCVFFGLMAYNIKGGTYINYGIVFFYYIYYYSSKYGRKKNNINYHCNI